MSFFFFLPILIQHMGNLGSDLAGSLRLLNVGIYTGFE